MKSLQIYFLFILIVFSGCGSGNDMEKKKKKLESVKQKRGKLDFQIQELEKEILELDTTALDIIKHGKLVTVFKAEKKEFKNFIDIQGTAESNKNVPMSAELGGEIVALSVKEGERVKAGQLLLRIDDEIILKDINEVKLALELAKTVFERQQNLWEKNIGSEIQLLEAKNKKESLEAKYSKLQSQLGKARVTAPVNGTVENIRVKIGEMAKPGMLLMNVLNLDQIIVKADVPERYVGKVHKGDEVSISFPATKEMRKGVINSVGNLINPANRTFRVEVELPNKDHSLKANLLAVIKIVDYKNPEVVVLPTRLIQQDKEQSYVFVADDNSEMPVAVKKTITVGITYGFETEILSGVSVGALVIDEGYHDVTEGSVLDIQQPTEN